MKRFAATILAVVIFAATQCCFAAALTIIKLNQPMLDKGRPLMQALKERKSGRQLCDRRLSLQHLSEILWAADGMNRPGGQRTAPSAHGKYPVEIYAVLADGVYLYQPGRHQLTPVAQGDFRKQVGRQDFVYIAPLNLVFVADLEKFRESPTAATPGEEHLKAAYIEAGCQAQNVNLYCASENLAATVRTSIDGARFAKIVKLRPSQRVLAAQTVGYVR